MVIGERGYIPREKLPLTIHQAHQLIVEAAQKDIFVYAEFVFGHKPAEHHKEWIELISNINNNKILIVAPRESAKTTWLIEIYLTWFLGHNPHTSNLILSATEDQAIQRLLVVRDIITNNPRYKMIFPWVEPDYEKGWTITGINLWDKRKGDYKTWKAWATKNRGTSKDHTLRAAGALSGTVIGNRYTGITLIDDIHDEKNVNTREQINKIDNFLHRTVLPCLRPEARIILIGTRWAPEDIVGRLKEKKRQIYNQLTGEVTVNPEWVTKETTAFVVDSEGHKVTDEDGNYISYWPENWPMLRLLDKSDEVGEVIFELMYMNNAYGMSGDIFKPEYLENEWPIKLPAFKTIDIGLDPAFTRTTRSDNTAIALIGVTEDFMAYTLKLAVGKFTKPQIINYLEEFRAYALSNFGIFNKVFVEKVGTQVLLIDDLLEGTDLPIEEVPVTNGRDKVAQAQAFSMLCARKCYFCDFTTREGRLHKGELLSFPTAPKDDTVDAVRFVINKRIGGRNNTRTKFRVIRPKGLLI